MDSIGYSLFAISLLLAANAFFVAAEFALVRIRSELSGTHARVFRTSGYSSNSFDTYAGKYLPGLASSAWNSGQYSRTIW